MEGIFLFQEGKNEEMCSLKNKKGGEKMVPLKNNNGSETPQTRIIYAVTDNCNTECAHCYRRCCPEKKPKIARELSDCKKDVSALMKKGFLVRINGAEVLTNSDYLNLYPLVGQDYLLTNGIILSKQPELCEQLMEYGIKQVRFSWHIGFQNVLNNIDERIIKQAISNSLKAGLDVLIAVVIGNTNFHALDEISKQVLKAGVKKLELFQLMPVRDEMRKYTLTASQKEAVFRQVQMLYKRYRKDELYIQFYGNFNTRLTEKSINASNQGSFCPAGKSFFIIETTNIIYPCFFLEQPQFEMGCLENGKFKLEKTIDNDGKSCLAEKTLITNIKS